MLKRWISAGLVVVFLAACGADEGDEKSEPRNDLPNPTVVLTLLPVPEMTVVPGCPAGELEDWFESAYFTMQSFSTEADAGRTSAENERREDTLNVLSRLLDLRNVVATTPTPSCVEINAQQVLSAMQGVIDSFQRFTSGEIDKSTLGEQVAPYIISLNGLLEDLGEAVNPLYQLTPSSSDSSVSTSAPE